MDWNRMTLLAAECVVFVTLGVLVALGHDSAVTDGMLAAGAAILGTGAYQMVKKKS